MREEFEKWAKREAGLRNLSLRPVDSMNSEPEYEAWNVQLAWQAFQAGYDLCWSDEHNDPGFGRTE